MFPISGGFTDTGGGGLPSGSGTNLPSIGDLKGVIANSGVNINWGSAGSSGDLKVQLTEAYDATERAFIQNRDNYLRGDATIARQRSALDFFDNSWKALYQYSTSAAAGRQGAISWQERQRNGKWPWEERYRDPIANDTRLSATQQGIGSAIGGIQDTLRTATGGEFGLIGTMAVLAIGAFIVWKFVK